jgi:hypothetical protein
VPFQFLSLIMAKADRHLHCNRLTEEEHQRFRRKYGIPDRLISVNPARDQIADPPDTMMTLYIQSFEYSMCRYPLSIFLMDLLQYYGVHFSQMHPLGLIRVSHFEVACKAMSGNPSVSLFRRFYDLSYAGDWFSFEKRRNPKHGEAIACASATPKACPGWKDRFIYISQDFLSRPLSYRSIKKPARPVVDEVPVVPQDDWLYDALQSTPTPIDSYPYEMLVIAGLDPRWDKPLLRPVAYNEEGGGML